MAEKEDSRRLLEELARALGTDCPLEAGRVASRAAGGGPGGRRSSTGPQN